MGPALTIGKWLVRAIADAQAKRLQRRQEREALRVIVQRGDMRLMDDAGLTRADADQILRHRDH